MLLTSSAKTDKLPVPLSASNSNSNGNINDNINNDNSNNHDNDNTNNDNNHDHNNEHTTTTNNDNTKYTNEHNDNNTHNILHGSLQHIADVYFNVDICFCGVRFQRWNAKPMTDKGACERLRMLSSTLKRIPSRKMAALSWVFITGGVRSEGGAVDGGSIIQ